MQINLHGRMFHLDSVSEAPVHGDLVLLHSEKQQHVMWVMLDGANCSFLGNYKAKREGNLGFSSNHGLFKDTLLMT